MQIIQTKHFNERIEERYSKDKEFIIKTFEHIIKKIKKSKIHPELWEHDTFIVRFSDMKFVYTKKDWKYIMITFWKRQLTNIKI